jgi:hypothetical protein
MPDDVNEHGVHIATNLSGRNPLGRDALGKQKRFPAGVSRGVGAHSMGSAVNFDRERRGLAIEIQHVRAQGMLPAELKTLWPDSKQAPKGHFGRAHCTPQLPSLVDGHDENPSTMLRMVPLPAQSRGG